MKKIIVLSIALIATIVGFIIQPVNAQNGYPYAKSTVVRIYYLQEENPAAGSGKHQIYKIWYDGLGVPMPEENIDTMINIPFNVLEFNWKYNRALASKIAKFAVVNPESMGDTPSFITFPIPTEYYYIGNDGLLYKGDGTLIPIVENPSAAQYKLSQLYGMSQAELSTYIDNQYYGGMTQAQINAYIDSQMNSITSLADAKTIIGGLLKKTAEQDKAMIELNKKMAAIELYLAKHSELDQE